ncbi:bifunctional diaminohydroxyphosphoribosylaminopyrimidine deaminase/5-amino-6-(5-phosphoribosylamino)uracil reductase RibD [Cerasicoccus arenae]|uniref:Riboflavin biosynthesis protein RibD n=1 Tax=Cerasicoccus arenae TaxID=424488 RepID=A0A8J3DMM8_9BACT|nr:bifunctional diaminohydroxyphosphoribosylaminopyrimidine deaminase/5-amino-6-(5-phosphoribosylamino)uracil reductase RibD [Cerasicoccus arenae]MBK1857794.1 bifunctional diaminohydroxyphosphoribosylaminopyrimidine deaminase/5-amino-6-(5-phosphoribosylamino)uracil reductase RibD [Cerasicoccus arenae]GHC12096.1 riboflavin biosynthesis protein RibD [Cerasicoccus arenae]
MPLDSDTDEHFMRHAMAVATRAWGDTHPNPMVGAIIVEQGRVVAEGWHQRAGGPHAEVAAIKAQGHRPRYDATIYVTLEPCCTQGRTGPCTDAIIERGFRRVVIGAIDPNPAHAGRGVALLREAGLEVVHGVLAEQCADINLIFNHWIVNQAPFLAAKVAMTLDGKIATRAGHSRWVTGEEARADVMRWRRLFPAIAVGAGTVIADDPALTARLPDAEIYCPTRFVFDRRLLLADHLDRQVFNDNWRHRTILVTETESNQSRLHRIKDHGVTIWELPTDPPNIFYKVFQKKCINQALTGVLIEGGCGLLSDMLSECLLDYLLSYRAPKLLADDDALPAFRGLNTSEMAEAITLEDPQHALFGQDVLTRGYLNYPEA